MTRKGKIVLGASLVLVAIVGTTYLATRPKFGAAPLAEILKVIDPRVVGDLPTEVEIARWKRFDSALAAIDGRWNSGNSSQPGLRARDVAAFERMNGAKVHEIESILDEGPATRPWSVKDLFDGIPVESNSRQIAVYASMACEAHMESGDYGKAADSLADGFRVLTKMHRNVSSSIDYVLSYANLVRLLKTTSELVTRPDLPTENAERLLQSIPEPSTEDREFVRAMQAEFRRNVLSWIEDPIKRFHGVNFSTLQLGDNPDGSPRADFGLFGNYNPYETAREANRIFLPIILNASRSMTHADPSGLATVKRLKGDVPMPPVPVPGFRSSAEVMWFKVRLNTSDNSFGKLMLSQSLDYGVPHGFSLNLRSQLGRVRAELAAHIRRKKSRNP